MRYELDDDWLREAGVVGFVPTRAAFRADPSLFPELSMFELAIADVEPLERQLSHGVFNDHPTSGSARQRVVNILRAFKTDTALPPVEVERPSGGSMYRFKLHHGVHRFYCAVAVGFRAVTAVDVTNRF